MMITVLVLQSDLSLSSLLTRCRIYIDIIFVFVLTYVNEAYILPRVSKPIIMLILGETYFIGKELVEPYGLHFILLWSILSSQLSSIFNMIFSLWTSPIYANANYYRRRRFISEFCFIDIFFILLYLIPMSFLIVC